MVGNFSPRNAAAAAAGLGYRLDLYLHCFISRIFHLGAAGNRRESRAIDSFTMFEQGQVTVVAAIGVLMIATLLAIVAVFYKLTGRVGIQT